MGNRAVITFHSEPREPAVYVHWNGGLASIEGFLAAQRIIYGSAPFDARSRTEQLHAVAAAYIGSSAYLEPHLEHTDQDNGDNGLYVVDPDTLLIVRREHVGRHGEEIDAEKTADIAKQCIEKLQGAQA